MSLCTPHNMITHAQTRTQRGAVLVVSMLLLLVMTLLAITGMRNTTLEEKMAGNTRDIHLAFNSAEAALRQAEALLKTPVLPAFGDYSAGDKGGYYETDSTIWHKINWSAADMVIACGKDIPIVVSPAVCYIEEMPAINTGSKESNTAQTTSLYRITARAVGGSESAEAILQVTYRR